VFSGADTPGTLGIALGDLDGDGRMDVVQAQGEHPTAVQERVFFGTGLKPDTAPPSVTLLPTLKRADGSQVIRARIHDRKSPTLPAEWQRVWLDWGSPDLRQVAVMRWYGEYLWQAELPAGFSVGPRSTYNVCARDAAGNTTCIEGK
jgi:hypothetical protein